jgi:phage FluMu gp28-like protein
MSVESLKVVLPKLYPAQRAAIYHPSRYVFIEASTKAGKTLGCIVWQAQQVLTDKRKGHHWWVAPVYPQAKIAFRRVKKMFPRELYEANESELRIDFASGSSWWFKSGEKPDNLYGEDVQSAVIDEASRLREDAWFAVRSTLTATQGPIRCIGNVKGRKNWFYKLSRSAQSGADAMHYAKLTAVDAIAGGVITQAEIDDARATLPDHIFRELYLAEPSDDGGNPFGLSAIERCVGILSAGKPVAWGWDLAKSHDWTVGVALDELGRVCRFARFQKPWEETTKAIKDATGAYALVDSTGVGDPILEALQRGGGSWFEGFRFSASSKQQLMEGLALAIQRQSVTFPEGPVAQELRDFEFEHSRAGVRYSAPAGLHDDCVCALALAVEAHRRASRHPQSRSSIVTGKGYREI